MADSNDAGFAAVDAMIRKLNATADLPQRIAPKIAKTLKDQLDQQIEAATDPAGTPWPLTKDGRKPLQNASKSLHVNAVGTRVVATLEGPAAMHHLGIARGHVRRQILPSRKMPQKLIAAIKDEIKKEIS